MSGPVRNPDKLNTMGIVVVGICGAVLVYVSIVALQAFYMNDTSDIQTMADYGGNDVTARSIRTSQVGNITEYGANAATAGKPATYRMPIDLAMKQVVNEAKVDPSNLVPTQGRSDKSSVQPVFGRPQPLAPAPGADAGSAAAPAGTDPAAPAGAGSAAPAGAGSAAPAGAGSAAPATAPTAPTGGQGPGGGPVVPTQTPAKGNAPQ